uniref:translocation and assembly module lipoprotein TamL n=1 Tax=Flavobacterium sp. TaxID=239 RepID=UPI00404A3110
MKNSCTKITLFILLILTFLACDAVKKVPDNEKLLVENEIIVDSLSTKDIILDEILIQKPNTKLLGAYFALGIYNLAKENPKDAFYKKYIDDTVRFKKMSKFYSKKQVYRMSESFFYSGIHNFLKNTGEAPTIVKEASTKRTAEKLSGYYADRGYFKNKVTYKIDSVAAKKAKVSYFVQKGEPYVIDTIRTEIASPELQMLYKVNRRKSFLNRNEIYDVENFDKERERINEHFKNNGVYYFQQNYINFTVDTVDLKHKANVKIVIDDYGYRKDGVVIKKPFQVMKISEVNIFTEDPHRKNTVKVADSIVYNDINIYSQDKIRFKPKALTNPVFVSKGAVYSENNTNLTKRYYDKLEIFKYPTIQYKEDVRDSTGHSLIANVYLEQLEKFKIKPAVEVLHSNIQDFGLAGNLTLFVRNVFNGAERFEFSTRGNIGSSSQLSNPTNVFFNILEYSADMRLYFPRVLMPFNTEKIIPKTMIPTTALSLGFSKQENIGLDKESFNAIMAYNWTPKKENAATFELVNLQYINNINVSNYFVVYGSSYNALNNIARPFSEIPLLADYFDDNNNLIIESGTNGFIQDVLGGNTSINSNDDDYKEVRSIEERRRRLTENNLILGSSFSYNYTTRNSIKDNQFYTIKAKLEGAGNALSLLTASSNFITNQNGNITLLGVEFSQYLKGDFEYIKLWDFNRGNILATRAFYGLAVPIGNSSSIPFSRSYFGGGSNDNRAWQPYSLGPGTSGGVNDFNEANMKISFNLEYRFNVVGPLKGALFADFGNIWNIFDNVEDTSYTFNGAKSLLDIAMGSGFGIRYDFDFFVIRTDIGFKTYNPGNRVSKRWFNEYNLSNAVLNIGVNYPF